MEECKQDLTPSFTHLTDDRYAVASTGFNEKDQCSVHIQIYSKSGALANTLMIQDASHPIISAWRSGTAQEGKLLVVYHQKSNSNKNFFNVYARVYDSDQLDMAPKTVCVGAENASVNCPSLLGTHSPHTTAAKALGTHFAVSMLRDDRVYAYTYVGTQDPGLVTAIQKFGAGENELYLRSNVLPPNPVPPLSIVEIEPSAFERNPTTFWVFVGNFDTKHTLTGYEFKESGVPINEGQKWSQATSFSPYAILPTSSHDNGVGFYLTQPNIQGDGVEIYFIRKNIPSSLPTFPDRALSTPVSTGGCSTGRPQNLAPLRTIATKMLMSRSGQGIAVFWKEIPSNGLSRIFGCEISPEPPPTAPLSIRIRLVVTAGIIDKVPTQPDGGISGLVLSGDKTTLAITPCNKEQCFPTKLITLVRPRIKRASLDLTEAEDTQITASHIETTGNAQIHMGETHSGYAYRKSTGKPTSSFKQQEINSGEIYFRHNGGREPEFTFPLILKSDISFFPIVAQDATATVRLIDDRILVTRSQILEIEEENGRVLPPNLFTLNTPGIRSGDLRIRTSIPYPYSNPNSRSYFYNDTLHRQQVGTANAQTYPQEISEFSVPAYQRGEIGIFQLGDTFTDSVRHDDGRPDSITLTITDLQDGAYTECTFRREEPAIACTMHDEEGVELGRRQVDGGMAFISHNDPPKLQVIASEIKIKQGETYRFKAPAAGCADVIATDEETLRSAAGALEFSAHASDGYLTLSGNDSRVTHFTQNDLARLIFTPGAALLSTILFNVSDGELTSQAETVSFVIDPGASLSDKLLNSAESTVIGTFVGTVLGTALSIFITLTTASFIMTAVKRELLRIQMTGPRKSTVQALCKKIWGELRPSPLPYPKKWLTYQILHLLDSRIKDKGYDKKAEIALRCLVVLLGIIVAIPAVLLLDVVFRLLYIFAFNCHSWWHRNDIAQKLVINSEDILDQLKHQPLEATTAGDPETQARATVNLTHFNDPSSVTEPSTHTLKDMVTEHYPKQAENGWDGVNKWIGAAAKGVFAATSPVGRLGTAFFTRPTQEAISGQETAVVATNVMSMFHGNPAQEAEEEGATAAPDSDQSGPADESLDRGHIEMAQIPADETNGGENPGGPGLTLAIQGGTGETSA